MDYDARLIQSDAKHNAGLFPTLAPWLYAFGDAKAAMLHLRLRGDVPVSRTAEAPS